MTETRIGKIFGKLTVLEKAADRVYLCRCECGTKKTFRWEHLRKGSTQSCGCARGVVKPSQVRAHSRVGVQKHPLYMTWRGIVKRCTEENHTAWHRYGGRGIKIHQPWQVDFFAFADYMGDRPSPEHTVDRFPDRDGSYEPGNVRWATPTEQSANTDFCFAIMFNGVRRATAQVAREVLVSTDAVRRARVQGFAPHEAIAVAHLRFEAYLAREYLTTDDIRKKLPSRVSKLKLGPV